MEMGGTVQLFMRSDNTVLIDRQGDGLILRSNINSIERKSLTMKQGNKYRQLSLLNNPPLKKRKNYIKDLQAELQQSRMAVETITTFKSTEQNLNKKIDQIQSELHGCMLKINTEAKKNKVLTELIALLKGEMFKFQAKQKKEEEHEKLEHAKKIKKIEYDIQQILQKHNEEVAKINNLKETASSCRSERVVFSNLFKKLEKEIKQYEERYKEQLLKTEIAQTNKHDDSIPPPRYHHTEDVEQNLNSTLIYNPQKMSQSFMKPVQADRCPFITEKPQSNNMEQLLQNRAYKKNTRHFTNIEQKQHPVIMTPNDKIEYYETFLEKFKIKTQCRTIDEIVSHYQSIQGQNDQLLALISAEDDKVKEIEDIRDQLLHQKRSSDVYDKRTAEKSMGMTRKIRSNNRISEQSQLNVSRVADQIGILQEVAELLSVNLQPENQNQNQTQNQSQNQLKNDDQNSNLNLNVDQHGILNNEACLFQIDEKLGEICQKYEKGMENRGYNPGVEVVEGMLHHMDRFHDCQKILDKGLFKQQYYKQLTKGKKNPKLKK